MKLHLTPGGLAICGRPGCDERIGTRLEAPAHASMIGDVVLDDRLVRQTWTQTRRPNGTLVYERKRQRHLDQNQPSMTAQPVATRGDVVICPRSACRAEQTVP